MECANCDRQLLKADKFCPECGLKNPNYKAPKKPEDEDNVTKLEKRVADLEKKLSEKKEPAEVL